MTTLVKKASEIAVIDAIDDEETTDAGQSSASETESTSGFSGNEAGRVLNRRCRFGGTALETIPATPSAGAAMLGSPPGLSRAAMRQARDSCQKEVGQATSDTGVLSSKHQCRFGTTAYNTVPKTPTGGAASQGSPPGLSRAALRQARDACQPGVGPVTADVGASVSNSLCRFGTTMFDTVPKTPAGAAKLQALKNAFGSPPGLSRAGMRQERDACRRGMPTETSWGSELPAKAAAMFQPPARTEKTRASREAFLRIKQEAALLKDLKSCKEFDQSEEDLDASPDSGSESESSPETITTTDQQCCVDSTHLGTVPATSSLQQSSDALGCVVPR